MTDEQQREERRSLRRQAAGLRSTGSGEEAMKALEAPALRLEAARRVLKAMERQYPGLADFVVASEGVALEAAAAAVAEETGTPKSVRLEFQNAKMTADLGLPTVVEKVDNGDTNWDVLVASYAQLADLVADLLEAT